MQRRNFLVRTGSVATLGIAGAGCLDDSTNNDSASHVEQAADYLDDASEILEEDFDEDSSFDSNRVTRRTESARDDLSIARESASDEEESLADALELLADVIDEFAYIIEAADELLDNIDTIDALIAADRFDDAADEVDDVSDDIDDIQEQIQNVSDMYTRIDADAYHEVDELSQEDVDEWATDMDKLLQSLNLLFDAFGEMIDGLSAFESGAEELENENWGAAAVRFEDAAEQFGDGASIVQDGEDEAPNEFRSDFIEIGCVIESLEDASENYANAMNYASDGRWDDFDEAVQAGDRAFDRC